MEEQRDKVRCEAALKNELDNTEQRAVTNSMFLQTYKDNEQKPSNLSIKLIEDDKSTFETFKQTLPANKPLSNDENDIKQELPDLRCETETSQLHSNLSSTTANQAQFLVTKIKEETAEDKLLPEIHNRWSNLKIKAEQRAKHNASIRKYCSQKMRNETPEQKEQRLVKCREKIKSHRNSIESKQSQGTPVAHLNETPEQTEIEGVELIEKQSAKTSKHINAKRKEEETPEEKERRSAKRRARDKELKMYKTTEQRETDKARARRHYHKKVKHETPEEREKRLARKRENTKEQRKAMQKERREIRRAKNRERARIARLNETPEEKVERLERNRQRAKEKRLKARELREKLKMAKTKEEILKENEIRLARQRACVELYRKLRTPEQIAKDKATALKYYYLTKMNETPEQREQRLIKKRETMKAFRKAKQKEKQQQKRNKASELRTADNRKVMVPKCEVETTELANYTNNSILDTKIQIKQEPSNLPIILINDEKTTIVVGIKKSDVHDSFKVDI